MAMNIDNTELQAVWNSIKAKASPTTEISSLTNVLQRQQRWLRHYREFVDEFQSLWIVELLEFVASNETFSEADVYRAAERARYAIRKAVRRSSREVSTTENLLSKTDDSVTHTDELMTALYRALTNVLDDEELVLLNSLFFRGEGSPLNLSAKSLHSKIYRLRRKIEPIVKSVLGQDGQSD